MSRQQRDFLSWAIGIAGGGAATAVFLFTHFETKADALLKLNTIEKIEVRIRRTENKINALLMKQNIPLSQFPEEDGE